LKAGQVTTNDVKNSADGKNTLIAARSELEL
jgi:hypothetical protein